MTDTDVTDSPDNSESDDARADETGSDETSVDQSPADEAGADDTGSDEATADDTGSDETTVEDTGSDETTADDTVSDEATVEDTGSDETTVEDTKRKLMIVGGLVAVLAVFGGLYFFWAQSRVTEDLADRQARALETVEQFEATQPESEPEPTEVPAAVVPTGPVPKPGEVLVVNRVPGDDYGRLAIRHADGSRTLLDRQCVRVHVAADNGVCLGEDDAFAAAYETTFFSMADPDVEIKSYASALPSRARLSPSGSIASVTAFVTGTSYEDISTETTTIVTIDEIESRKRLRGANQFAVEADEDRYDNLNVQYWGMTFADDNEFYITAYFSGAPEIMHGSLDDMTVAPTGWIGSCPSLSPDGKTLVFKEMRQDGGFDLVAVDVATQDKWKINESRSVDDQVEWLDEDTILYALHPEGGDNPVQPEFDVWMIDIAEGSEPVLFLPNADSPAVAR